MEKEELKQRLIEILREKYPNMKVGEETSDWVEFDLGEGNKHRIFYDKLKREIEESYPQEWEKLIKKRGVSYEELAKSKPIRLVPRIYSKGSMPIKEMKEKGFIIIEGDDDVLVLSAEFEDHFMTASEQEYLKLGFSQKEIDTAKNKLKGLL
jgi:hypothetical protein